jgi:ABC-type antimicrobial peptide transport system permease subunit
MSNLRRVPARATVGALSLAVGVCALTVLLAITRAFHGAAVGSLLGDAITLQVRGVDYVAVIAMILLGAVATADVLYLAVRERAGEFAALRAVGWSERSLLGLVAWEGVAMAVVGSLVGAAGGLALTAVFTSSIPPAAWLTTVLAATLGVLVVLAAIIVPAVALRRLPTAAVLAEEN